MTLEQAFKKAFYIEEPQDPFDGAPVVTKHNYKYWLERLEAELKPVKQLVKKIDMVHNSTDYQRAWRLVNVELGRYLGPTYEKELEAVRQLLSVRQEP